MARLSIGRVGRNANGRNAARDSRLCGFEALDECTFVHPSYVAPDAVNGLFGRVVDRSPRGRRPPSHNARRRNHPEAERVETAKPESRQHASRRGSPITSRTSADCTSSGGSGSAFVRCEPGPGQVARVDTRGCRDPDRRRLDGLYPGRNEQRLRDRSRDGSLRWEHRFRARQLRPERARVQLRECLRQHGHDRVRAFGRDRATALAAEARDRDRAVHRHRAVDRQQHRVRQHGRLSAGRPGGHLRARCPQRSIRWKFSTIRGPWRHPDVAGGGGAWYTASVDADGNVYSGVANPYPAGGTLEHCRTGRVPRGRLSTPTP